VILSVLAAAALVYSWKLLGYLLPDRFVTTWLRAFAAKVTVALLAALVGIQTFVTGDQLTFDARVPAVMVAMLLFFLRVPFVIVIVVAAASAAGLRLLGL
jgi:ABC-type methionine transport system permease subunit